VYTEWNWSFSISLLLTLLCRKPSLSTSEDTPDDSCLLLFLHMTKIVLVFRWNHCQLLLERSLCVLFLSLCVLQPVLLYGMPSHSDFVSF
jgi:hypothetical protein